MNELRVTHSIKIRSDVLRRAKAAAAEANTTLGQWLEQAIEQRMLSASATPDGGAANGEECLTPELGWPAPGIDASRLADPSDVQTPLDITDYRIIAELQKDASQTDAQVARTLGISEVTVGRRIARMLEDGVFRIMAVRRHNRPILSEARLLMRVEPAKVQLASEYLARDPRTSYVTLTAGRFDLMATVVFESPQKVSEYIHGELARVPGIISTSSLLTLEIVKRDFRIVSHLPNGVEDHVPDLATVSRHTVEGDEDNELDSRDRAIIALLQEDARQSEAKIARTLGISEATVRRRARRLRADGVIKIITAVDGEKVGYTTAAFIGVQADLRVVDRTLPALVAMRNVYAVTLTAGEFDIYLWVAFRTPIELSDFLKRQLPVVPGILRSETFVNVEVKKLNHRLQVDGVPF